MLWKLTRISLSHVHFFQTKLFSVSFQLYLSSTVKLRPVGSFSKNRTSVNEWQSVIYVVCVTYREEGSCRMSEITSQKSGTCTMSDYARRVRQICTVMSG